MSSISVLLDWRIPVPIWFLILCMWPVFFHQGTFTMFSLTPVFWKFTLLYLGVGLLSLIILDTVGPLSIGTHGLYFWRVFLTFLCSFLSFSFSFYNACYSDMCMYAQLLQSYSTLCEPMDCSPPDSSVLPERMLDWVSMPSSRGSSWPRDRTHISYVFCIGRQVLYHWLHLGSLVT